MTIAARTNDVPFNMRQRAAALRRQVREWDLKRRTFAERIAIAEAELREIEHELAGQEAPET